MAYKIRYQLQIDYVGPGAGPMQGLAPAAGNLAMGGSTGQSKGFVTNPAAIPTVAGSGTFVQGGVTFQNALASGDITTLLAQMQTDLSAQLNAAATLAQLQAWVAGNP